MFNSKLTKRALSLFGLLEVMGRDFLRRRRALEDFGIKCTFVEVTNFCNMHCKFCPSDHILRERESMDFRTFKNVIDQLVDLKTRLPIALHVIGEPLQHRGIFRFIDYCGHRGVRIYLFTNGLKIKENIKEICRRDNIDALVLSVQTPTEKSYMLRGSGKPFREYMQDIYVAIDYIVSCEANKKMRVEIHLAETKDLPFREWDILTDSIEGLEVMKGICRAIKHSDDDFSDMPENFINLREWDYWGYQVLPNIYIRIKHFGTFGGHTLPGEVVECIEPIQCSMANDNLCILSNGAITICCLDVEGELSLGNVRNKRIIDALKSKKRAAIIADATRMPLCRRCKGTVMLSA